jgi:glycosyltransferase involved in cell wall biosynthesis
MPVRISVIIPLYNKRDYIIRCLESIRAQTVSDFEAVVIDDGSTDGGADVAETMRDPRIRVIRQPNAGPGAARNRGLQETSGDLVAFLDADDEWRPGFLEAMLRLASVYPNSGFFATGYRRTFGLDYDREITLASADGSSIEISNYLEWATEGDFLSSSSIAVRRGVLSQVGYFQENEPLGEDVDLWVRIGIRYRLAFEPAILAIYHSESTGGSFERCRSRPPYPPVVRTLRRLLREGRLPASAQGTAESYIDLRLLQYAFRLLHLGDREGLLELLRRETWKTPRFAREARVLQMAVAVLPLRVVFALKWKPLNLLNFSKRFIKGDLCWMGSRVIERLVPVNVMEPAR